MLDRSFIRQSAAAAGFDLCGVAPCRHLVRNEQFFRRWLGDGRHASLGYLERNLDKRFDVRRLVEGAQTVVVCAVGYKNGLSDGYPDDFRAKIASYALTADYHATIKGMLGDLFGRLRAAEPALAGRAFVDSAPLVEKQLAVEAGLGWIGRQSLLVTPRFGSFVLLGELVLDAACDRYDEPLAGVPPLRRSLPDRCRLQRPRDRCAPLHLLSYDRTDAGCGNCPRWVDFRLRRLPEPLPLQPPCAAASSSGVRSAVRSLVVPARTVARDGGGGIPHVVRPHAAHAQRPPAPPSQCGAKPAPKGKGMIAAVA